MLVNKIYELLGGLDARRSLIDRIVKVVEPLIDPLLIVLAAYYLVEPWFIVGRKAWPSRLQICGGWFHCTWH
jgi:hypothetical protein